LLPETWLNQLKALAVWGEETSRRRERTTDERIGEAKIGAGRRGE